MIDSQNFQLYSINQLHDLQIKSDIELKVNRPINHFLLNSCNKENPLKSPTFKTQKLND
jgi:hypothetical protein